MRVTTFALIIALFGGGAMLGCDRTQEKATSTEVKPDGTVVEKKKSVETTPEGDKVVKEKKTVDKPND